MYIYVYMCIHVNMYVDIQAYGTSIYVHITTFTYTHTYIYIYAESSINRVTSFHYFPLIKMPHVNDPNYHNTSTNKYTNKCIGLE